MKKLALVLLLSLAGVVQASTPMEQASSETPTQSVRTKLFYHVYHRHLPGNPKEILLTDITTDDEELFLNLKARMQNARPMFTYKSYDVHAAVHPSTNLFLNPLQIKAYIEFEIEKKDIMSAYDKDDDEKTALTGLVTTLQESVDLIYHLSSTRK